MNYKKISRFMIAPAVLALALVGCSDKEDRVVGTVNDIEIKESQLNEALQSQYGTEVLEQLMANEIIKQEAKAKKLTISEEDLNEEYEIYADYYGGEEKLLESLKTYNVTKQDILNDIEVYLLTVKVMEQSITLTDEEIKTYYEENKANYLSDENEQLPLEKVKEEVRQALLEERIDSEYDAWLDEKFEEYDVRSDLYK
jgi:foldase protein PrsA